MNLVVGPAFRVASYWTGQLMQAWKLCLGEVIYGGEPYRPKFVSHKMWRSYLYVEDSVHLVSIIFYV